MKWHIYEAHVRDNNGMTVAKVVAERIEDVYEWTVWVGPKNVKKGVCKTYKEAVKKAEAALDTTSKGPKS